MEKPTVAIHTFTTCDGCQSAFIHLNIDLFEISSEANVVHFAQLGLFNPNLSVDIAFVSGGVSWPHEVSTIQRIRRNSRYLVTMGACSVPGGIATLKNITAHNHSNRKIYASSDYVHELKKSWVIASRVKVDYELWGCPITSKQCLEVIRSLSQKVSA